MVDRFEILVPKTFIGWSLGARAIAGGLRGALRHTWGDANKQLLENAKSVTHVISGRLQDSARQEITNEGNRVVATVEFTAPYAPYEFGRGGDHDALSRGWEMTQGQFEEQFGGAWNRVVAVWGEL